MGDHSPSPPDDLLAYQRCRACGAAQSLQRHACAACGSTPLDWQRSDGRGTVYAVTVVSRAPSEAFRALVPYTLVLVDLAEGPRRMGHAAPGVAIGDSVRATTFQHAGQSLLRFVPDRPE
ncbi:MAG TPA: OB-fold domain-containing protein [Ramlibacter sp.]|nr:OB-fold domain-containing protein [Ramlibacter sp.]